MTTRSPDASGSGSFASAGPAPSGRPVPDAARPRGRAAVRVGAPRPGADAGSAAIEFLVLVPVVLLLLVAGMQFALYGLAAHAVALAAAEGGAEARARDGSVTSSEAVVVRTLASLGGRLVESPSVHVTEAAGAQMTVVVSGSVPALVPGLHMSVTSASVGPAQEFRGDG